jgi:hypothetical protein
MFTLAEQTKRAGGAFTGARSRYLSLASTQCGLLFPRAPLPISPRKETKPALAESAILLISALCGFHARQLHARSNSTSCSQRPECRAQALVCPTAGGPICRWDGGCFTGSGRSFVLLPRYRIVLLYVMENGSAQGDGSWQRRDGGNASLPCYAGVNSTLTAVR